MKNLDALLTYLDGARALAFDPVRFNCCVFVMGAIEALTGARVADHEGIAQVLSDGMPETEIGIARVLAEFGGVRGLAETYFGEPAHTDLLNAARGDIVIAEANLIIGGDGETLGVVDGDSYLTVGTNGLSRHPLMTARGYWPIP